MLGYSTVKNGESHSHVFKNGNRILPYLYRYGHQPCATVADQCWHGLKGVPAGKRCYLYLEMCWFLHTPQGSLTSVSCHLAADCFLLYFSSAVFTNVKQISWSRIQYGHILLHRHFSLKNSTANKVNKFTKTEWQFKPWFVCTEPRQQEPYHFW